MKKLFESFKRYLTESRQPSKRDIIDAMETLDPAGEMDFQIQDFDVKYIGELTEEEILEFEPIELENFETQEDFEKFRSDEKNPFWKTKANTWLKNVDNIPPIIIITGPNTEFPPKDPRSRKGITKIGDGIGRLTYLHFLNQQKRANSPEELKLHAYHMIWKGLN